MLERLDSELNDRGVHMMFVELRSRLHDLVTRYGLLETLDRRHFYDSIDDALTDIVGKRHVVNRSNVRRRRRRSAVVASCA